MQPHRKTELLLKMARKGPLRPRDLDEAGIPRAYLRRMCDRGLLERVDRGIYRMVDAPATELHSLAEVCKRVPRAVVCLLSALQVHELTSEVPHAVWIMIDRHARAPKFTYPKLEIVRASGAALEHGVDVREVEGVTVRVTAPAKTVADCFRFRRHVGLDVALLALRDYVSRISGRATKQQQRKRRAGTGDSGVYTMDALVASARADRVYPLMRPYLEALV
jgi:predicted transcriptional regulator of viral defense system